MKPGLQLPGIPKLFVEWSFPAPGAWDVDNVRPLREAVATTIAKEFVS